MDLDFGELDFEDSFNDREDRMRSAFLKSKAEYAEELMYNEPLWYNAPDVRPSNKLSIRNIDYRLNDLYLQGSYEAALDLALNQLHLEEANMGKDGREYQLIDIVLRCALKCGRAETFDQLADRTREKWTAVPGLALTSAEIYAALHKPEKALSAILSAISLRGMLPGYASVLCDALMCMGQTLETKIAVRNIMSIVQAYMQKPPPISDDETISAKTAFTSTPRSIATPVTEEIGKQWTSAIGLSGSDEDKLLRVICDRVFDVNELTEGGQEVKSL